MLIEFCLPIKNEEEILAQNAGRLYEFLRSTNPAYGWRIVMIVNGSDDRSADIARDLERTDPASFRARSMAAGGKGRALKEYFRESKADILVFMDIDLAVSLDNLPALIDPVRIGGHDLAVGSRLLNTSHTERSFWRSLTSRSYNFLSRLVLKHDFSDLQCGFKAIRRPLFDRLRPWLEDDRWFFDTELVIFARHLRRPIKEVPVDWQENRYDERRSKIRVLRDVWPFIINLFRLRARLRHL